MSDTQLVTRCVACRQIIPERATICSICRSYQRSWLNWLQYISGATAFIIVAASAATWLIGNARGYLWYRDDVRVIAANSDTGAIVWNRGDGDVFVSHLNFYMTGRDHDWMSAGAIFEEKISPGQFVRREFSKDREKKQTPLVVVRGESITDFEADIVKAVSMDPCYELVFFEGSDARLAEVLQIAGPTINTFPVHGYLKYWSMKKNTPTDIALVGRGIVLKCTPKK